MAGEPVAGKCLVDGLVATCPTMNLSTPRTAHDLAHPSCIAHALKTCAHALSRISQALKTCEDNVAFIAHPGPNAIAVPVARIVYPGQTCADELSMIATIPNHVQMSFPL